MAETIQRQWDTLRAIPRLPHAISVQDLRNALEDQGHFISTRSLQRDLQFLALMFPLHCDATEKPYLWSWDDHAPALDVPGLDNDMAIALYFASRYLENVLPVATLDRLRPYFEIASKKIDEYRGPRGLPAWGKRVRILHRGPGLAVPQVDTQVLTTLNQSLLENRKVELGYFSRDAGQFKTYVLEPLGLIYKDSVMYLVAKFEDSIRTFAVHRIKSIDLGSMLGSANKDFDMDDWIASGALSFVQQEEIVLQLRLNEDVAFHLQERPLSENQELILEGNQSTVTATVRDTSELRWWILGFGDRVEVLAPKAYRQKFVEITERMAQQYK